MSGIEWEFVVCPDTGQVIVYADADDRSFRVRCKPEQEVVIRAYDSLADYINQLRMIAKARAEYGAKH